MKPLFLTGNHRERPLGRGAVLVFLLVLFSLWAVTASV